MLEKILNIQGDIVLDIESNHPHIHQDDWEFWGCGFAAKNPKDSKILSSYTEDRDEIRCALDCILIDDRRIVGHNIKFDLRGLRKEKLIDKYPVNLADTMVATNLVDENIIESRIGLKARIKDVFNHQMATYKETSAFGRHSKEFFDYGKEDCFWTLRYWLDWLQPRMIKDNLEEIFYKIYMHGLRYACEQEERGCLWSVPRSEELIEKYKVFREDAKTKLQLILGDDINLNSNKQLGKRMFEDMRWDSSGVPRTEKTKQFQLNKEVVEVLAVKYPEIGNLINYRNAAKMIGTYLEPNTLRARESMESRIHPSVYLTSVTGRKRQREPNFQNQPVIKDPELNIRSCVEAPKGMDLIVVDLSQMELRLMAHVSQDAEMRSAYTSWECHVCDSKGDNTVYLTHCPNCGEEGNEQVIKDPEFKGFWHGKDIHQMTADVTGMPRSPSAGVDAAAKNVNFAAIYLATAWKMKQQFGTYTEDEWEDILNKFFRKYQGVKRWHIKMEDLMYSAGQVSDIFGRIRRIPSKSIRMSKKHSLNMFVNFPIQSAGSHYLMLAEKAFRDDMVSAGVWLDGVWPSNEVHDEVIIECRKEFTPEVSEILLEKMRYTTPDLSVPINADLTVCDNWGGAK